MTLPQTLFQVVAILLLVVPGIIFTATRRFLRGPGADEKDFSVRLIHAIAASVIFDCFYLIVAGPWLVSLIAGASSPLQSAVLARPRISGLTVLILAVVIPALAAVLAHVRFRKRWYPFAFAERRHSTPTAWDYAATQAGCYIRIYTSDGKWVGGFMPDKEGFIATYPEPRDIYIPQQWRMSPAGAFLSQVEGTLGIYVPLTGAERVEWVASAPPSADPTGS